MIHGFENGKVLNYCTQFLPFSDNCEQQGTECNTFIIVKCICIGINMRALYKQMILPLSMSTVDNNIINQTP